MGRSVETCRHAIACTFTHIDIDDDDSGFDWDCFREDIQEYLGDRFPSLWKASDWLAYPYRETSIILRNSQVEIGLSEYCGLVAIQVIPRGDIEENQEALAARNGAVIGDFIEKTWGTLRKLGTFSNGEAVFERAS